MTTHNFSESVGTIKHGLRARGGSFSTGGGVSSRRICHASGSRRVDRGNNFWPSCVVDFVEKKNINRLRPTHFVVGMHGGKNSFHCRIITLVAGDVEVTDTNLGGRRSGPSKNDTYHNHHLGLQHVIRIPPQPPVSKNLLQEIAIWQFESPYIIQIR